MVNFAPCFYYTSPDSGDIIKSGPVEAYVQRVAFALCDLISNIKTQNGINKSFDSRIKLLENKSPVNYTLPLINPICIASPSNLLPLSDFTVLLEKKFCELIGSVGSSTAVYNAITVPVNFNNAKALGTAGGLMGSTSGWVSNVLTLSDSFNNLWLTLLDARSAIRNIQVNYGSSCGGIGLTLQGTLENKVLRLFVTGTVPPNLVSCVAGGSSFNISDSSGNSFTSVVDIKGNLNNISGVSIDLNSTSINFADDLHVRGITCFSDPNTGTVCQNVLDIVVNNNSNCPVVTTVSGLTALTFSFVHTSGTLTYSIQLFDSTNVMIQSQNRGVNSATTISGTFAGLTAGSLYRIRLQMIISPSNTKTCPLTPVNTLSNPCSPPNGISVTLVYS